MARFPRLLRPLGARAAFWCVAALLTGMAAAWIWMSSQAAWHAHQNRAYIAGIGLHDALRTGTPPPPGIEITPLQDTGGNTDVRDVLRGLADAPSPAIVTSVPLVSDPTEVLAGIRLQIHLVSSRLRYPVADIAPDETGHPAANLGNLARLLASYCADPLVLARTGEGEWLRIDGNGVWGCAAAPADLRLLAVAVAVAGLAVLLYQVAETASHFSRFSAALKWRGQFGRREAFAESGPEELREIVRTVNRYFTQERERLDQRAMVLSSVSHDLGTPATRLRLRSALIADDELRTKLEADIDQMTGMIESVLTFTRAEMSSEEAVELSLTSLVESVVSDYEDVGMPVQFRPAGAASIERSHSLFSGQGGRLELPREDARRVLVSARPVSLRRAISNLIDNSLKYGRRAIVSVEADSMTAQIIVEDEGTNMSEEDLNALTGPFLRGENAAMVGGVGLGLTIVSTIARQHGGEVVFERVSSGLRAILRLSRR